jgi:hypothetical protein
MTGGKETTEIRLDIARRIYVSELRLDNVVPKWGLGSRGYELSCQEK